MLLFLVIFFLPRGVFFKTEMLLKGGAGPPLIRKESAQSVHTHTHTEIQIMRYVLELLRQVAV